MWLLAAALAALQSPCGCSPVHPAERVYSSDLVFTARVFRSAWPNMEYTVVTQYKGKAPARIMVYDLAHACNAPEPEEGREYLVLARRSAGLWVSGPCEGTMLASEGLRFLRHVSGDRPRRTATNLVTGQVVLPSGQRASALVKLKRGSTIYYATADDLGLFAFTDVPPGEYAVEAVASGFRAVKTPVIGVAAKGITRTYLAMDIEKTRKP